MYSYQFQCNIFISRSKILVGDQVQKISHLHFVTLGRKRSGKPCKSCI